MVVFPLWSHDRAPASPTHVPLAPSIPLCPLARSARDANNPEAIGAVESVKAASDIYAPLSGKIVAINEELGDQPSLLNKSPEKDGWLAKIQTEEDSQFNALMDEAAYKAHCEGQ